MNQSLDANLKVQNMSNSVRQVERCSSGTRRPPTTARERRPAVSVSLLEPPRRQAITVRAIDGKRLPARAIQLPH